MWLFSVLDARQVGVDCFVVAFDRLRIALRWDTKEAMELKPEDSSGGKEHIDLYAAIKGVKLTRSEVSDMLAKVVILSLAEKARQ